MDGGANIGSNGNGNTTNKFNEGNNVAEVKD